MNKKYVRRNGRLIECHYCKKLQSFNGKRWTWKRKKELLQSIEQEKLTIDEAMTLHDISHGELNEWIRAYYDDKSGKGLRVTVKRS